MRGKRIFDKKSIINPGITPAGAGKTFKHSIASFRLMGSPPRVRGKRSNQARLSIPCRITPACAGKTTTPCKAIAPQRDHHRVCGENFVIHYLVTSFLGSPPRVRGKRAIDKRCPEQARITPACAGKTHGLLHLLDLPRDHPRVCGENCLPWFSARL